MVVIPMDYVFHICKYTYLSFHIVFFTKVTSKHIKQKVFAYLVYTFPASDNDGIAHTY